MTKILIVDDHSIVRYGLKELLLKAPDFHTIDEIEKGSEVVQTLKNTQYDVVILDISMPDRNGLEILKDIKIEYPSLPVLMLSMHPEEQYAIRSLKAGANGYITKISDGDEIVEAVRQVASGRKYVSKSLAEKLAVEIEDQHSGPLHKKLSDREYQVMCMIASGKTISQIASELSLSVQSISTYRSRILEKLDMNSSAEITYYAIKNGLIE